MSKEGRHLLSSLATSGKEDDSQWDVKLDWETVQRYDVFKQLVFLMFYHLFRYLLRADF